MYARALVLRFNATASAVIDNKGAMDHHALNAPPSNNDRKLRHTATPPATAETSRAVACHLFAVSSAAANINHAVPARHTVSKCRDARPSIAAKEKAVKLLTANNKQPSDHGDILIARVIASQIAATVIDARLNQPR